MSIAIESIESNSDTCQRVEVASDQWKKFLRSVLKNVDEWTCRANDATGWKLQFSRVVPGELGTPDVTVTVRTDFQVAKQRPHDVGVGKAFHDAKDVTLLPVTYLFWRSWDIAALVAVLLQDATLEVEAHRGSVSSSEHGIGYYELRAHIKKPAPHYVVLAHCVTVAGHIVSCGVLNFR